MILYIENKAHDIRHMSLVNLTSHHTVIPSELPVMRQDADEGKEGWKGIKTPLYFRSIFKKVR